MQGKFPLRKLPREQVSPIEDFPSNPVLVEGQNVIFIPGDIGDQVKTYSFEIQCRIQHNHT